MQTNYLQKYVLGSMTRGGYSRPIRKQSIVGDSNGGDPDSTTAELVGTHVRTQESYEKKIKFTSPKEHHPRERKEGPELAKLAKLRTGKPQGAGTGRKHRQSQVRIAEFQDPLQPIMAPPSLQRTRGS